MKLTLNVAEVQEAVTQHIIASGFPVGMENASIFITEDGAEVVFHDKPEANLTPRPKRKAIPKAKKPKEVEAGAGVENGDEEEEPVEEVAVKDEPETATIEETEDLILTELDEKSLPVSPLFTTGSSCSSSSVRIRSSVSSTVMVSGSSFTAISSTASSSSSSSAFSTSEPASVSFGFFALGTPLRLTLGAVSVSGLS